MAGAKSRGERAVMATLAAVAAFAALAGWVFWKSKPEWIAANKKLENVRATCAREEKMISERATWDELYEEEASRIPVLAGGQGTDTVWMRMIGDLAKRDNVFVTEMKPGKAEVAGDMEEVKVDVRWTAALESLVRFMYDLENHEEGRFDVHSISFSQGKRQGYLGGNMTLTCIFKR